MEALIILGMVFFFGIGFVFEVIGFIFKLLFSGLGVVLGLVCRRGNCDCGRALSFSG